MADLTKFQTDIEQVWSDSEEQREAANEDIRFIHVPGGMWEDWLESTHNDTTKRARLELDLTSDFVNRYLGEWTLNRANVRYTPDDTATSDDDAELLTGIYRSFFKDNDGQPSQDNAVSEAAECGYGAFKLSTRFEDEEDPENDKQEVVFDPLYNAYNSVIWEQNAKRADKSDAKWCAVLTTHTEDAFKEQWPKANTVSFPNYTTRNHFDWNTTELITVVERYEVKKEKKTVRVYQHVEQNKIKTYTEEEVEKIGDELKADGWEFVRERKKTIRTVYKSIFNGEEFLQEEKRIAGKYIPIIPVYGFRRYIDGIERYYGLVRKRKDANRVFNTNVSRIAENAAASPDSKPIFDEDEVEGRERSWTEKDNAYYLKNPILDGNGNRVFKPMEFMQPTQIDPNTVASTEIVNQFLQMINGSAPTDHIDPDASGKAIDSLKARENLNTQVMSDNILMSIKHSGAVFESIASEILVEPRNIRTLSVDGSEVIKQVNEAVMDEETGELVIGSSITDGKFKVDVDVGPQYETQREATVGVLIDVIQMVGDKSKYFDPLMAMLMKNISGTGLEELKEFNRNEILKMGLAKPETEEEIQMLQHLSQQVDPQTELNKSIAEQQKAEAQSLMAGAKQKLADAEKKKAETKEIYTDMGLNIVDRRLQQLNPGTIQ